MMLHRVLQRKLVRGNLVVIYGDGSRQTYGDGSGPRSVVKISPRGERRILLNPGLALGETYMDGDLELVEGGFWELTEALVPNFGRRHGHFPAWQRALFGLQRQLQQWNDRRASRRNVHHHYDLSHDFYRRFLDSDLQYSCAYFPKPRMSLDAAQKAKKTHLASKLLVKPGHKVLDIGCGWGGLGLELAGRYGADVTGVTLSTEQLAIAQQRAKKTGLEAKARFELIDYRDVEGQFDRIISVGMLEHVGAPHLGAYFRTVAERLTDNGVALIHAIGSCDPPGVTQPFIRKYIFPGGYIPSLSQVTKAVEDAGLWITDVEILRLHYAETLRLWRDRFLAQRDEIRQIYDERFCRMWEVYLCFSEAGFRFLNCMVFQIQLTKDVAAAPMTRDYIYEAEHPTPVRRKRAPETDERPEPRSPPRRKPDGDGVPLN